MTKFLCLSVIIITSILNIKAQDNFVSGSYIESNGTLQKGLISLKGNTSTPQSFLFKKESTGETKTVTNKDATSFYLESSVENRKFVLKSVLIYESSDKFDKLNNQREVNFIKKNIFVETIIESEISLFKFQRSNKPDIFFYSNSEDKITTLVHKKYLGLQNKVKENNSYKQQLFSTLKCNNEKALNFEGPQYNENSLVKLWQSYIECSNSNSNFLKKEVQNKPINVKASIGAGFNSLSTETAGGSIDFGKSNYVSFGGELELLFAKDSKWGLVLNLATYSYSNTSNNEIQLNFPASGTFTVENEAEINGLDLNLGLRHYINLSTESAIFLGVFFGIDPINTTEIKFLNIDRETITAEQGAPNFAIAAGYQLDKLSVEFKLNTAKDHLREGTIFNNSSLIYSTITLRYQLFNF